MSATPEATTKGSGEEEISASALLDRVLAPPPLPTQSSQSPDNNNNYNYEGELEEEDEDEEESDFDSEDELALQDEALYDEVLAYLLKRNNNSSSSSPNNNNKKGGAGGASSPYNLNDESPVSHMPRSMAEKAYGKGARHVTVQEEPSEIIPGPVELMSLPLGLGLLWDVSVGEDFAERWNTRTLEKLPPFADKIYKKEDLINSRLLGSGSGEKRLNASGAASAAAGGDEKKEAEGEGEKKEEAAAEGEKKKEGEEEKKKEEEPKKEEGEGDDAEPEEEKKKKKRIVVKDEWGGAKGVKPKLPPAPKKTSMLVRTVPENRLQYDIFDQDINEGMLLQGPPQWLPYVGFLCALAPPRPDRCLSLYETGTERLSELSEKARAKQEAKEKKELEACTFKPVVSKTASGLQGWKGDMEKFYKDKLEWQKHRGRKVEKNVEKKRKEEEELLESWKMAGNSKKILERRDKKLRAYGLDPKHVVGSADRAIAASGIDDSRGVALSPEAAASEGSSSGARVRSLLMGNRYNVKKGRKGNNRAGSAQPNFTPVTNAWRTKRLEKATTAAARASSAENSVPQAYNFTSVLDEFETPHELLHGPNDEKDFISRMDDDLEGREERKKQRAIQFARQQKEKLFDPVTGQPLFEPNAAPTIIRQDGGRVSFQELSGKEKKDLIRKLKQQKRLDFVPGVLKNRIGDHTLKDEDMQEMYKRMLDKVRQGNVRIDRIRRKEDQQLKKLFRPTIDPVSQKKIDAQGKLRKPVYKQPLPQKEEPPPPPPQPKSSKKAMNSVVARNETFISNKKDAIEKELAKKDERQAQGLTFKPSVSKNSNKLISERRNELQKQIASLEDWRHHQGGAGTGGSRHSGDVYYASDLNQQQHQQQQQQFYNNRSNSNNSNAAAANNNNNHSPPNLFEPSAEAAAAQHYREMQRFVDPQTAQYMQRERQWHRPEARKLASKQYFEPKEDVLHRKRISPMSAQPQAHQQRHFNEHYQQQQQQQSQQPQQQGGYDEIDNLVGSMLSQQRQPHPQNQQQQQQQQQQRATQHLRFDSNSPKDQNATTNPSSSSAAQNNNNTNSSSSRYSAAPATRVSPQQQQQQQQQQARRQSSPGQEQLQGSNRRLQNILSSWDELERETAAALN